jgi:hypothetical protein
VLDDGPPRSARIAEKLAFIDAHAELAAAAAEVRVRLAVASPA